MPAYATGFNLAWDSSHEYELGDQQVIEDMAADGTPLTRYLSVNEPPLRFTLIHRWLTQAQAEQLRDEWKNNRNAAMTWTYKDGSTYTGVWGVGGVKIEKITPAFWQAIADLRGRLSP